MGTFNDPCLSDRVGSHRQSNAAMDNDWRRRDSPAPVPPVQMAQLTDTEPMHPGLQPMASQESLLPTSNELWSILMVNNH